MVKEDDINIKLEVCKDNTSGKLSIIAHFNSNSPNIVQDENGFLWFPTEEEKDFLNEAFELFPIENSYGTTKKITPKPEQKFILPVRQQIKKEEKMSVKLQQQEKSDESEVFEITEEETKTDNLEKNIDKKIKEASKNKDEEDNESETEEKEQDKGIIVEADSDAIEAALKKHMENDKTIVEVDEQTIIDKVLNQKKKGKWSRR